MESTETIIDFLNDYYEAQLHNIHDVAGNQHLLGYSKVYQTDIFVKIFTDEDMFDSEQIINHEYYPDIYLDTVIFSNRFIVVLKDRKFKDNKVEDVDSEKAYEYGQLLADFHKELTGRADVKRDSRTLRERALAGAAELKGTKQYDTVQALIKKLDPIFQKAEFEYEMLPHVVMHGDFSVRNIKHYQDQDILIDFEWSQIGVAYEDMIKFFYSEVKDPALRKAFLKGYRSTTQFEIPSQSLQQVLLLLCAIKILIFHKEHKRRKFGSMATDMLQTILDDDAVIRI